MQPSRLLAELRLPLFRNAYALLLSSVLASGLGVVYWAVAARLYPTTDVGIGASLVSALMFVAAVSQLNLRFFLFRYVPTAGRHARRLIGGTYLSVAVAALVLGSLTAAIALRLGAAPTVSPQPGALEIVLFALSAATWSIFAFQDQVLAAMRLSVWVPVSNLAFGFLKLAVLLLFVSLHPFGVFLSWMAAAVVGAVIVSAMIFGVALPRWHDAPILEAITVRGIIRYLAPDYVAGILATALGLMPVLVYLVLGADQSAYFYPVWLLTTMVFLIPVTMFTSLFVESSAGHVDFQHAGRGSMARILLGLAAPVAVLTVGAPLVLLIFGPDYADAGAMPMRLLAISALPFTVNSFAAHLARSRTQMARVVLIEAGVTIPALVLAILLLPRLGLTGAALAMLLSQSTIAFILLATVMRPVIRGWRRTR
jgi:O-antigen/teichoic acid export membrane protein